MLKSRQDLTMLSGFAILGDTDGPTEKHCVLCGFGVIGDRDIEHASTCPLDSETVTHVRITGVRRKRKRKVVTKL